MNCRLKTDSDHLKVEEDKLKVVWHAAEENFICFLSVYELQAED
jgi:hypothetical protein